MKPYIIRFPEDVLTGAINAVRQGVESYESRSEKRNQLNKDYDPYNREQFLAVHGTAGLKRLENELTLMAIRDKEDADKAVNAVLEHKSLYEKFLHRYFDVSEEQLTGDNAAAVNFINSGMIDTPEELMSFMQKHSDNPSLIRLADRYAVKKASDQDTLYPEKWEAIHAENTSESDYRGFLKVFDQILAGAMKPNSYDAMWCSSDDAMYQCLKEHNLKAECVSMLPSDLE